MDNYKERLKEEHAQLEERVTKLNSFRFIGSSTIHNASIPWNT